MPRSFPTICRSVNCVCKNDASKFSNQTVALSTTGRRICLMALIITIMFVFGGDFSTIYKWIAKCQYNRTRNVLLCQVLITHSRQSPNLYCWQQARLVYSNQARNQQSQMLDTHLKLPRTTVIYNTVYTRWSSRRILPLDKPTFAYDYYQHRQVECMQTTDQPLEISYTSSYQKQRLYYKV